jgi:hypothetical protein
MDFSSNLRLTNEVTPVTATSVAINSGVNSNALGTSAITVASGLVAGNIYQLQSTAIGSFIGFSAEL